MTEKRFDPSQPVDEYYDNYLKAASFDAGDEILTIAKVEAAMVFNEKTNALEEKPIVRFEERTQPMVLNKTKARAIVRITGKKIPNEWVGVQIKVGKGKTQAFGKITDAIIVRDEKITAAATERATQAQIDRIRRLSDEGQIKLAAMLEFYGIQDVSDLSRKQAADLIRAKTGEVIE